jgi:hypothetical protein
LQPHRATSHRPAAKSAPSHPSARVAIRRGCELCGSVLWRLCHRRTQIPVHPPHPQKARRGPSAAHPHRLAREQALPVGRRHPHGHLRRQPASASGAGLTHGGPSRRGSAAAAAAIACGQAARAALRAIARDRSAHTDAWGGRRAGRARGVEDARTEAHARTHARTHAKTNARAHTQAHTQTRTHARTHAHRRPYPHTHRHTHLCMPTSVSTCTDKPISTIILRMHAPTHLREVRVLQERVELERRAPVHACR